MILTFVGLGLAALERLFFVVFGGVIGFASLSLSELSVDDADELVVSMLDDVVPSLSRHETDDNEQTATGHNFLIQWSGQAQKSNVIHAMAGPAHGRWVSNTHRWGPDNISAARNDPWSMNHLGLGRQQGGGGAGV